MSDIDVAEVIDRSSWFTGLPEASLKPVVEAARIRNYPRGSFVYSAGECTAEIFCLLAGRIRLGMTSALGQEFAITDLEPEAWFGEQSLTSDDPRVLDALAIDDATLLHIPRQVLQTLAEEHPRLYKNLFSLHVDITRKIFQLLGGMLFYPLRARLAGRLLQLAEQHGEVADGGIYLNTKLSQNDFARLSLGSRQRINKIFREWYKDDVIVMKDDKYFIKNLSALKQEIDLTAL